MAGLAEVPRLNRANTGTGCATVEAVLEPGGAPVTAWKARVALAALALSPSHPRAFARAPVLSAAPAPLSTGHAHTLWGCSVSLAPSHPLEGGLLADGWVLCGAVSQAPRAAVGSTSAQESSGRRSALSGRGPRGCLGVLRGPGTPGVGTGAGASPRLKLSERSRTAQSPDRWRLGSRGCRGGRESTPEPAAECHRCGDTS